MIECEIKALTEAIVELNTTFKGYCEIAAKAPAAKKTRRTKAEIAADKAAEIAAKAATVILEVDGDAPPPPPDADNSSALPVIGDERIVSGYTIPGYVAAGDEADYIASVVGERKFKDDEKAVKEKADAACAVDPIAAAAAEPISLEEFNEQLAVFAQKKGFLVVSNVIEQAGCPVAEIDPQEYDNMLAQLRNAPDA